MNSNTDMMQIKKYGLIFYRFINIPYHKCFHRNCKFYDFVKKKPSFILSQKLFAFFWKKALHMGNPSRKSVVLLKGALKNDE